MRFQLNRKDNICKWIQAELLNGKLSYQHIGWWWVPNFTKLFASLETWEKTIELKHLERAVMSLSNIDK